MFRFLKQPLSKSLPGVLQGCFPKKINPSKNKYSFWRGWVLFSVYALILLHFLHWRFFGETLAPLEFNEATFTSQNGLITLGFLFMTLSIISVIFFGRFFCGWACHILALQDLCAYLLNKVKIKPSFVYSRWLMFVPVSVFFYMFLWVPFKRFLTVFWPDVYWLQSIANFNFRLSQSTDGLSSFITTDMWRNLPDPLIAVITLFVCGFAVVYFLGSRSFCAYVCPYGALFSWADKLSVGKVSLTGDCLACGKCTAACKSGVQVMDEVRTYGKVVNSNCFKDMDCIAACPENALSFQFSRPSIFMEKKKEKKKKVYAFSLKEEISLLILSALILFLFLGLPSEIAPWAGRLYGKAPLLLSVTLAVMSAFIFIYCLRIFVKKEVHLNRWVLKKGVILYPGKIFLMVATLWTLFLVHSSYVQYNMFRAGLIIHNLQGKNTSDRILLIQATQADRFLQKTQNIPLLLKDARINRQRAWLALFKGEWALSESYLRLVLRENHREANSTFQLGWILAAQGKFDESLKMLHAATALEKEGNQYNRPVLKAWLYLVEKDKLNEAMTLLIKEILLRPQDTPFYSETMDLLSKTLEKKSIVDFLAFILQKQPHNNLAAGWMGKFKNSN